jgi:phosphoglycerate dehydrogenase-like enzyme
MNQANETALQSFAEVVSDRDRDTPLSPAELTDRMWGCSAILSLNGIGADEITQEVLRKVATIKVICVSHYWGQLDETAKAAGVAFTEGSNACTIAVAEWTVATALMGVRKIQEFDRSLKNGSPWAEPRRNVGLLCESTIGLVGMGRIGWHVAHYFNALGANVIAYDKYCKPEFAASAGVQLRSLQDVLKKSDVLSLHLPVTAETKGMLGANEFAMIKDGAVFINSARAALYDEAALVAELKKKRFTAYLDVYSAEPLSAEHPFRTMSNVTITPHIAGDNGAMFLRCGREAIQTLKDYFEGRGLRNLQYSVQKNSAQEKH